MSELLATLRREAELLALFAAALDDEQAALRSGNAEALPVLSQTKAGLIPSLNEAALMRNRLLRDAGCAPDAAGMQAWLAANSADHATRQAWQVVLERARAARQTNEINGNLIAQRLQATQEAVGILTQKARQTNVYGPDGLTGRLTGLRIIDSA